jgi:hypothetical protein
MNADRGKSSATAAALHRSKQGWLKTADACKPPSRAGEIMCERAKTAPYLEAARMNEQAPSTGPKRGDSS